MPITCVPWWSWSWNVTSRCPVGSQARAAHPTPWMLDIRLEKRAWKASNEPNASSMRIGQLSVGVTPAVGRHALPEQRVQLVAAEVEGEGPFQARQVGRLAPRQLLERLVGTLDVGRVVLVVVQLHQLGREVRLRAPRSRTAGRAACSCAVVELVMPSGTRRQAPAKPRPARVCGEHARGNGEGMEAEIVGRAAPWWPCESAATRR